VTATSSQDEIRGCLESVFEARYARATLIQAYSRQQARPATDKGSKKVKLNPAEFMDYNCKYEGAKDWCKQQSGTDTVISVESLSKAISVIL
jgi:salicylate hydroxylase